MCDIKICSKCYSAKAIDDFYRSQGCLRSECKECTKANNLSYQKKNKVWKTRYADEETRKEYLREYYQNNKDKYAKYRQQFADSHPDYHRDYYLKNKDKTA